MKKNLILCIDDDADVLDSIRTILATSNYESIGGRDGAEGFELFKKHEHDLIGVLVDARMPVMNGLDFAEKVRETGSHIPIVLVTAYLAGKIQGNDSNGVTVKQYVDAGVNAHIEKPFSVDDILQAIKMTFGLHEQEDIEA
ncbi:MAG: response regulator [Kiritimatiellae bacterium]|nr:response regulator [Kiritimatiellia bacterium]